MLRKLIIKLKTKVDDWLIGDGARDGARPPIARWKMSDDEVAREFGVTPYTTEAALKIALDLVASFVGKCSSYEVAGWPFKEVRQLVEVLRRGKLDEGLEDTLITWLDQAKTAEAHEAQRAKKPKIVRDATADDWAQAGAAFEKQFGFKPSGDAYMSGELQSRVQVSPVPHADVDGPADNDDENRGPK